MIGLQGKGSGDGIGDKPARDSSAGCLQIRRSPLQFYSCERDCDIHFVVR